MSFFTAARVPAKPLSLFSMTKGLSFAKVNSLFVPCITKHLGYIVIVDSSLSEEGSTAFVRLFVWGVSISVLNLFPQKCSQPALESNKRMHRSVVTITCPPGIQFCYTPRRQYYKRETSGEVSSTRLPKATPFFRVDPSASAFW